MWHLWMIFWVTACERENDEEKTCGFIAAQLDMDVKLELYG